VSDLVGFRNIGKFDGIDKVQIHSLDLLQKELTSAGSTLVACLDRFHTAFFIQGIKKDRFTAGRKNAVHVRIPVTDMCKGKLHGLRFRQGLRRDKIPELAPGDPHLDRVQITNDLSHLLTHTASMGQTCTLEVTVNFFHHAQGAGTQTYSKEPVFVFFLDSHFTPPPFRLGIPRTCFPNRKGKSCASKYNKICLINLNV